MPDAASIDVFVSYSTRDDLIALALVERLRKAGLTCWIAPESIAPGRKYDEVIAVDLPRCRTVLILLSDKANYSHHVKRELTMAVEECKPIFPIRVEDVQPSKHLRYALTGSQWLDAFPEFRRHLDAIAQSVRMRLEVLTRESPVVRITQPQPRQPLPRGQSLEVHFDVSLGPERRLKRVRIELRREGNLLQHRPLKEAEINDRGGPHTITWDTGGTLDEGSAGFQIAVLASDTEGQEGSAFVEAMLAPVAVPAPPDKSPAEPELVTQTVDITAAAPDQPAVEADTPSPAAEASVSSLEVPVPPVVVTPEKREVKPALAGAGEASWRRRVRDVAGHVAEMAFGVIAPLVVWAWRLAWMLAVVCAIAAGVHTVVEPYVAKLEEAPKSSPFYISRAAPVPKSGLSDFPRPSHGASFSIVRDGHLPATIHEVLKSMEKGTGTTHGILLSAQRDTAAPGSTAGAGAGTGVSPGAKDSATVHEPFHGTLLSKAGTLTPQSTHGAFQSALNPDKKPVPSLFPATPSTAHSVAASEIANFHLATRSALEPDKDPAKNKGGTQKVPRPPWHTVVSSAFDDVPLWPDSVTSGPGKRIPGRPLMALWEAVTHPSKWSEYFHAAIPRVPDRPAGEPAPYVKLPSALEKEKLSDSDANGPISAWAALFAGGLFGLILGASAGLTVGVLVLLIALIRRVPLAMMPLGEDQEKVMREFNLVAVVAAIAVLDMGVMRDHHFRYGVIWWVAGAAALCFLLSSFLREMSNRQRQQRILG